MRQNKSKILFRFILCGAVFAFISSDSALGAGISQDCSRFGAHTAEYANCQARNSGQCILPSGELDMECIAGTGTPDGKTETQVTDKIKLVYPTMGSSVNLNDAEGKDQIDIHYTSINRFEDFGTSFIRFMTGVLVLITVLVFMIGAGFWIFSAGNEALVGRGKDMMIYSGGGMLMSLGAYVLVKGAQVVLYALGT